jgi:integrase/recombinase XerD
MSPLRLRLVDYLATRRALGFKLDRAEKLLSQFLDYLEQQQLPTITTAAAVTWATQPAGASSWWHAMRLTHVRQFARWLHGLDAATEIPPAGILAGRSRRAIPYLYSDADIGAIMEAASMHRQRLPAATYPVLIGLLAVTGMRIGEALALRTSDFDPDSGVITVRSGKDSKARLLPLQPSTTEALQQYLRTRDRLHPHPDSDALFISRTGSHLCYNRVHCTFNQLARQAGLNTGSASPTPRIHHLRHYVEGRVMCPDGVFGLVEAARVVVLSA